MTIKNVELQALNFEQLVGVIRQVHDELSAQASRAVNASLTLRNWLIGLYVEEYERQGVDRVDYGDKLMDRLAECLTKNGVSRCDRREIYRYRQLYLTYPQIVEAVTPQLHPLIGGTVLGGSGTQPDDISQIVEATPQFRIDGNTLISKLSFTHIVELLNLEDAAKRAFYELECIQGNWSVRELKRQIHSLYFERCGLSLDKKKLSDLTRLKAETRDIPSEIKTMITRYIKTFSTLRSDTSRFRWTVATQFR